MSILKNAKQHNSGNSGKEQYTSIAVGSRHPQAKKPGTRVGTLNDWREGGAQGPSDRSQHGKRLRDGQ